MADLITTSHTTQQKTQKQSRTGPRHVLKLLAKQFGLDVFENPQRRPKQEGVPVHHYTPRQSD
jgi:hypothetical protein